MEKNTPKLRFPEFSDDWEKKKAGSIFKNHSNKIHNSDLPILAATQDMGMIPRDEIDKRIYSSQKSIESYKIVEVGDFVISLRSFQGGIEYSKYNGLCSPAYTVLKALTQIADEFYKQYLKKDSFISRLSESVIGIRDGKQISFDTFSQMPLPFPSLQEQQKIGDFLSAVDKFIDTLKKKKELLEKYKKGAMQKIFSREIRFKDDNGKDYPDWEEKRLGEVSEISRGKGISKADINILGNYKCIVYGELYTKYAEVISNVFSKTSNNKFTIGKFNDVLIPASGEDPLEMALASCLQVNNVGLGGDINIIRSNQNGIFLSYTLNHTYKKSVANIAQGKSVVHIYPSQLAKLAVSFPSLPEQKKIADFLSAVDKKIDIVAKQLENAELYKKSLLQQMFV